MRKIDGGGNQSEGVPGLGHDAEGLPLGLGIPMLYEARIQRRSQGHGRDWTGSAGLRVQGGQQAEEQQSHGGPSEAVAKQGRSVWSTGRRTGWDKLSHSDAPALTRARGLYGTSAHPLEDCSARLHFSLEFEIQEPI